MLKWSLLTLVGMALTVIGTAMLNIAAGLIVAGFWLWFVGWTVALSLAITGEVSKTSDERLKDKFNKQWGKKDN